MARSALQGAHDTMSLVFLALEEWPAIGIKVCAVDDHLLARGPGSVPGPSVFTSVLIRTSFGDANSVAPIARRLPAIVHADTIRPTIFTEVG